MHDMVRSSLALSLVVVLSHRDLTAESATGILGMPNDMLMRRTMAKTNVQEDL